MVVTFQVGVNPDTQRLRVPPLILSVSHLEVLRTTSLKSSVAKKFDLICWHPLRISLRPRLVK